MNLADDPSFSRKYDTSLFCEQSEVRTYVSRCRLRQFRRVKAYGRAYEGLQVQQTELISECLCALWRKVGGKVTRAAYKVRHASSRWEW